MKNFRKIICLLMAAMMLFALAACGNDDGSLENYLENNNMQDELDQFPVGGSGEDTPPATDDIVDIPTTGSDSLEDYIPEGGDAIPEVMVGSWSYVEIYQWALASDITVDEAISREKTWGVHFAYGSFSRYSESIDNPVYKTNTEASFDDMTAFGIDPSGLKDIYGADASVTSVTVHTSDGAACTTVFLINDAVLIAFGEGMNVFMYEAVEAVG